MSWLERHRGPFRFEVVRHNPKKKGSIKTEWLQGQISASDVDAEATALLDDPRDTIISVNVWSLKDNQFVHTYRGKLRDEVA